MPARIRTAGTGDQPLVRSLLTDCLKELSAFGAVDETYPYFLDYWTEPTRYPYVIEAGGESIGFIFINRWSPSGQGADRAVAEFYVAPRWRRRGYGMDAARQVLQQHPGRWELAFLNRNVSAQAFWPAAIMSAGGTSCERIDGRVATILRFLIAAAP
jgi:predicted acetyltransferase